MVTAGKAEECHRRRGHADPHSVCREAAGISPLGFSAARSEWHIGRQPHYSAKTELAHLDRCAVPRSWAPVIIQDPEFAAETGCLSYDMLTIWPTRALTSRPVCVTAFRQFGMRVLWSS